MPANPFIETRPRLVYDFSDRASEWENTFPIPTLATVSDSARRIVGTNSIRVQNAGISSANSRVHRDGSYDFSGTGSMDDLIHIRVIFENGELGQSHGEGSEVRLYLHPDASFSKAAYMSNYAPDSRQTYRPEVTTFSIKKSDFAYQGGFVDADWDSPMLRLAFYVRCTAGSPLDIDPYHTDVTFDALFVGGSGKVPITFRFDDNYESQEQACDDLEGYGWRTTLVTSKGQVDIPGGQTLPQLQARHAKGHTVLLHSTNHDALDVEGEAAVIEDMTECAEWIEENFGNWAPYYAAPRSSYNQATVDHAMSLRLGVIGISETRDPCSTVANGVVIPGYSSLFDLDGNPSHIWGCGHFELNVADTVTGTAALMIPLIDICVARNIGIHIYLHQQVIGAPVGGDGERTDWLAILAHIKTLEDAGTVLPMAWHEWANYLTGHGHPSAYTHESNLVTGNAS